LIGCAGLGLVACGGGSGVSSNVPSGTPSQPAQTNTTLTSLVTDQTYNTASATISGHLTSGSGFASGVTSAQSGAGTGASLSYDKSKDRYTFRVNENGVSGNDTFGSGDTDSANTNSTTEAYEKKSKTDQTNFILFIPGNSSKNLSYVTYGAWQHLSQPGSGVDFETSFVVGGIMTPAGDMPTTGSANYSAIIDGVATDSLGFSSVGGSASITADFASGGVTGSFSMSTKGVVSGTVSPLDVVSATGTISSNTFSGTMTGQSTAYKGTWNGGFFGPKANEIGGSFRLVNGSDQAIGVFVGNQ
jgi:hypothetical protein